MGIQTVGNIQYWPNSDNGFRQLSPHDLNDYTGYMQVVQQSFNACVGNVHHWVCDHAETCKCGKATRKVEPPKCPGCGKTHGA